jgi:hypothetical protein
LSIILKKKTKYVWKFTLLKLYYHLPFCASPLVHEWLLGMCDKNNAPYLMYELSPECNPWFHCNRYPSINHKLLTALLWHNLQLYSNTEKWNFIFPLMLNSLNIFYCTIQAIILNLRIRYPPSLSCLSLLR